jgi:SP family sugar:H+ symporter-like MFS transporter
MLSYNYIISFASAIGGFLFGYEIGVVDQLFEMRDFGLRFGLVMLDSEGLITKTPQNADIRGNITFTFLMGCAFGALCVGALLADYLGRKRSILTGGSLFAIGGLAQAFVSDIGLFYTGRIVSGVGIGILSMVFDPIFNISLQVVPLYISETAPTSIRGRMVAIQQLMITIGVLFAALINISIRNSEKGVSSNSLNNSRMNESGGSRWLFKVFLDSFSL